MRTYTTQATLSNGARRRVQCKTNAKTRTGIMRALGKAAAHQLNTDVFECHGLMWREGAAREYHIGEWRNDRLAPHEDRMIWEAAHYELMDMMAA